ncbi:MAG: PAS domain S-box protein [Bacteroidetes bacterium]|nr:PAS domain S-box protein [Bacteroidota bacterium]
MLESFVYLCYLTIARIRSVNALTESEKTYRLLADNVRDVIFTLDLKLNYKYVSPSVKILRGYESSELIGKSILNSLSPESTQIVTGIFLSETENIRLNKPIHAVEKLFEVELLHKEGYTVWAEIKASFILDEDKNPVGILGITRDIKERKLVEHKLLEKNRELNEANAHKNKFFSIIAHDLKNPFGNILNFSGLLKEQYHKFPEAKQLQFISLIHKSSEQIYHLLENLLDWSRSQGGKMDFFHR